MNGNTDDSSYYSTPSTARCYVSRSKETTMKIKTKVKAGWGLVVGTLG
jgi:hypothetical protein